jgi:hypothetical protein
LCAIHLFGEDLYPASLCGLPDGVEDGRVLGKRAAPNYGDAPRAWNCVEEQLQPLTTERCLAVSNTREIAAWTGEARDDSEPDRIGDEGEDDRYHNAGLFEREDGWRG